MIYNLKTIKEVVEECKPIWGTYSTSLDQNGGTHHQVEPEKQSKIEELISDSTKDGHLDANLTYEKILEVAGDNLNLREKKNLKKKLKRKQKKLNKQNPGFAHSHPDESDDELGDENLKPIENVAKVHVSQSKSVQKPTKTFKQDIKPKEVISDPFE